MSSLNLREGSIGIHRVNLQGDFTIEFSLLPRIVVITHKLGRETDVVVGENQSVRDMLSSTSIPTKAFMQIEGKVGAYNSKRVGDVTPTDQITKIAQVGEDPIIGPIAA